VDFCFSLLTDSFGLQTVDFLLWSAYRGDRFDCARDMLSCVSALASAELVAPDSFSRFLLEAVVFLVLRSPSLPDYE
jgi:hypothetical protein